MMFTSLQNNGPNDQRVYIHSNEQFGKTAAGDICLLLRKSGEIDVYTATTSYGYSSIGTIEWPDLLKCLAPWFEKEPRPVPEVRKTDYVRLLANRKAMEDLKKANEKAAG